jgi:virginiamycin B lyase
MRTVVLGRLAAVVMTAGLLAGCTDGTLVHVPPEAPLPAKSVSLQDTKIVSLQEGDAPSYLAFGTHGALWFTEPGGNEIAQVTSAGELTQFPLQAQTNNDPQDIVDVPGGSIWFTGLGAIGRIAPDGSVQVWRETVTGDGVWLPDALTVGPAGAIWYTEDSGHVCRVTTSGKSACFGTHPSTTGILMHGLAIGSDGALWFTEDNPGSAADPQNAIGRLTASGRYRQWLLPPGSSPTRIAAGPDGALWFTERVSQRIGRITTAGAITQFPLPRGIYPSDIISGPDGALWFTTDTRVGRITTAGQITLWPVPGAQQLGGIAAAQDGSLWLADGVGDAIRHFIPPE